MTPQQRASSPLDGFNRLTDIDFRTSHEAEHGLFIAEGATVIGRALAGGFTMRACITTARWRRTLDPLLSTYDAPEIIEVDELAMRELTGYRVHRGALASFERRPLPGIEEVVRDAQLLLVLEDLVDHTNVGAIWRSAAALGADAVLVSPGCADPLYRRSIRVSMGSVLTLPWTRSTSWPQDLANLAGHGWSLVSLTPDESAADIDGITLTERTALVIGTEGAGLSAAAAAVCTHRARIPMRRTAIVDSLNAAAAAAVALYALGRRHD